MEEDLQQQIGAAPSAARVAGKRSVPQAVFDAPCARRAAKLGHEQACRALAATPRHMLDTGNPNHPDYDLKLFGYEAHTFMAKQFR